MVTSFQNEPSRTETTQWSGEQPMMDTCFVYEIMAYMPQQYLSR